MKLDRARRAASSGQPGRGSLSYAGVDLLLTGGRQWKVIEINDHPVALAQSHELCVRNGALEFFQQDPFQPLAKVLQRHDADGPVALLLPECFELERCQRSPSQIRLSQRLAFDDTRVDLTIADFNELSRAVKANGGDVHICDTAHLRVHGDELYLDEGKLVRSLFRRHSSFPTSRLDCFCLNDLRQRALCGDKSATHRELAARLGEAASIPTFPFQPNESTLAFLEDCASRATSVIVKPRWGSASVGISRMDARQALRRLADRPDLQNLICQPWIPPAIVELHERSYHFDVRLYVVAGQVVSGFARRAAAPSTGVASDSPLAWLTTTGPKLAICHATGNSTDGKSVARVTLSAGEIETMTDLASRATLALSDAGDAMDYRRAVDAIPAFHSLADMEPEFEVLQVAEA